MKKTAILVIMILILTCVSIVFAGAEELPTVDMIRNPALSSPDYYSGGPQQVGYGPIAPLPILPPNQMNGGTIQFAWGTTSAVVNGFVPAGGAVTYDLYAMANQNFMVLITSDTGSAYLGITDAYGYSYLDPNQYQSVYSMYLPRTATYYVTVYGIGAGTNYSLQVFIPARLSIPFGQTKVQTSGQIGPYGVVSYTAYMYAGQTAKVDCYTGNYPAAFLRVSGLSSGYVYLDYTQYMPSWYAKVPATDDYLIEVISLNQPANYTLTVDVK